MSVVQRTPLQSLTVEFMDGTIKVFREDELESWLDGAGRLADLRVLGPDWEHRNKRIVYPLHTIRKVEEDWGERTP